MAAVERIYENVDALVKVFVRKGKV